MGKRSDQLSLKLKVATHTGDSNLLAKAIRSYQKAKDLKNFFLCLMSSWLKKTDVIFYIIICFTRTLCI